MEGVPEGSPVLAELKAASPIRHAKFIDPRGRPISI
jgi:hypothetical protein